MIIILFILISLGVYLILADIFKISTLRKKKVLLRLNKKDINKKNLNINALCLEYATKLSKFIKLDDYKREKLRLTLRAAQINISPEVYLMDVYIKTILTVLISMLFYCIHPILSIIGILLVPAVYMQEYSKADMILKKRRKQIEYELTRFATTIEQELQTDRDVLRILETYRKNSKTNLGRELEITIADMRSGSYEEALRRFEIRVRSTNLSEIIRGLIGVLNGNDEVMYFKLLSNKLEEIEIQNLRAIALKRPQKIKKYSLIMLGCLMLTYIVVLGQEVINGVSNMF